MLQSLCHVYSALVVIRAPLTLTGYRLVSGNSNRQKLNKVHEDTKCTFRYKASVVITSKSNWPAQEKVHFFTIFFSSTVRYTENLRARETIET